MFVTQKTVPEPAALVLAALAGFALARRRSHRS
jgi:MYXO-CTERM domain-containing protein